MKYVWRKEEKDIYLPKEKPVLVNIKPTKYICIKGEGNPNSIEFSKRIEVLYSLSYAIKMMPKSGVNIDGYFDYTVYPLEGLWDLSEKGRNNAVLDKDELLYTIMIKQPDFVNEDIFNKALYSVKSKKNNPLLDNAYFDIIEDGLSVQMLHVGSYDNESETFDKMKEFIKDNNLSIRSLVHREIYLSDARKTEEDKQKTVLRYTVIEN